MHLRVDIQGSGTQPAYAKVYGVVLLQQVGQGDVRAQTRAVMNLDDALGSAADLFVHDLDGEGIRSDRPESTAQTVRRLKQSHFIASLHQLYGCAEATEAATNHGDTLRPTGAILHRRRSETGVLSTASLKESYVEGLTRLISFADRSARLVTDPTEYCGEQHPSAVDARGCLEISPGECFQHAPDIDVQWTLSLAPRSIILDTQLF